MMPYNGIINILNDYTLYEVFSYLSLEDIVQVGKVCKRWYELHLRSPQLHELDMTGPFDTYAESFGYFRIKQSQKHGLHDTILMKYGDHLKIIKLIMAHEKENIFNIISVNCPNLKEIILLSHRCLCEPIVNRLLRRDDSIDRFLCHYNKRSCLRSFPLSEKFPTDFYGIEIERSKMCNLTAPILNRFEFLAHLTIQGFNLDKNILCMIGSKKTITHLCLANCFLLEGELYQLTNLVNLQYLNLAKITWNNDNFDDFAIKLAANCSKLTYLNINGCIMGHDDPSHSVNEICNSLDAAGLDYDINAIERGLHTSRMTLTDRGLSALSILNNLQELHIRHFMYIKGDKLQDLSNLKILDCGCCKNINETSIIQLIEKSTNLEFINVSNCTNITMNLIQQANTITKKRTNSLMLRIIVDRQITLNNYPISYLRPLIKTSLDFGINEPSRLVDIQVSPCGECRSCCPTRQLRDNGASRMKKWFY